MNKNFALHFKLTFAALQIISLKNAHSTGTQKVRFDGI